MSAGFTLIESLVVLLAMAILLSLAAPGLQSLLSQQQLSAATSSYVSAFHLARQTAIQLHHPVSLCAGHLGACHSRANWDWSKGWIVFVDPNRNGLLDHGEVALRTGQALSAGLVVKANAPINKSVIFTSLGTAEQPSGAFAAGRLRICMPVRLPNNARDLVLSKSGRLRLEEADFSGACPAP